MSSASPARETRNDPRSPCRIALCASPFPHRRETFAVTGGTVALGDGSQPIPNGVVVVRDGRIVAAGDMRMKLPAGTQVIDATGKWVTPGIVAGFSRLGLAEVDLTASKEDGGGRDDTSGAADDTSSNGPFNAAIDVVPAINPLDTTIAVNRADGVTRALVAPEHRQEHFRRPGRGDRHGRRHGADYRCAQIPVRRARRIRCGDGGRLALFGASPCSATRLREAVAAPPLRNRRSSGRIAGTG